MKAAVLDLAALPLDALTVWRTALRIGKVPTVSPHSEHITFPPDHSGSHLDWLIGNKRSTWILLLMRTRLAPEGDRACNAASPLFSPLTWSVMAA